MNLNQIPSSYFSLPHLVTPYAPQFFGGWSGILTEQRVMQVRDAQLMEGNKEGVSDTPLLDALTARLDAYLKH